jgi:predicted  nucleic acid-binding Zn-ribbon protein
MRVDQEMYSLRSKISLLEHEIEDRDSEIRRLHIELDAVSNRPAPEPATSEEEVQELRGELGRKQRELINMRYDLEDSQYRLETAANTVGMLKNTVSEYQERMINDREQYEAALRDYAQRERRTQEEMGALREELDRKPAFTEHVKTASFGSSGYSEEEVAALR